MQRVLIASPVKQKETILKEFLQSLTELKQSGLIIEYAFIDDNEEESDLLRSFATENPLAYIVRGTVQGDYQCNEQTHYWQEELMWKVAGYKDYFLQMARERCFDFLFLVDSDLALHPETLVHLVGLNKDIVSEVYWTRWEQEMMPLPQVWVSGQYRLFEIPRGAMLSEEEIGRRQGQFLGMLQCPGLYKVGGLGACTLISSKALQMGVAFKEIYNLELIGEDRHFCVRAAALGFELYADTCYPPYHIYRESELPGLSVHKEKYNYTGICSPPKLTVGMLVRNEANRYLEQVLQQVVQYADHIVILDDASEDETVEICRRCLHGVPATIVSNPTSEFHNEIHLRKQLWDMAVATKPDWILILDADEIFERRALCMLHLLLLNPDADGYAFRLYDMWSESHYREDQYWQAHHYFRPFLVRFKPDYRYVWRETPQHCGRLPANITDTRVIRSMLRVKHLGWIRPQDKLDKFYRYKKLDPAARYGIAEQYLSILDPRPTLLPWLEDDRT